MAKAIFLAGFSNWGKSTLMKDLFGIPRTGKISSKRRYIVPGHGVQCAVYHNSNDDITLAKGKWFEGLDHVFRIIDKQFSLNARTLDLFSCLCPTTEMGNDFVDDLLLSHEISRYDSIDIILIETKYDGHAMLMVDEIKKYKKASHGATYHVITAGPVPLTTQLQTILARIYP